MKLVKDKYFYYNILAITIPLALQNLISFATSMLDTLMLGRADNSGALLSASNLANQPFFLLMVFVFGVTGAGCVLASQYWGKQNIDAIKIIFAMLLKISLGFSAALSAVTLLFPRAVMGFFTNRPEIIEHGAEYLSVVGWTYVVFAISMTFVCGLRSVEIVRFSAVVNLVTLFINAGLNYLLIFGKFGFPAMGIRGAAIATLIARVGELCLVLIFVFFVDKRVKFRPRDVLRRNRKLLTDFVKHGSPVIFNEIFWALAITAQAAIIGRIGYASGDPVAAHAIAGVVQQLASILMFGIANAATVLIGKSIGEGDVAGVKLKANTFKLIALIAGLFAGGLILAMRNVAVGFYNFDADTSELARQLLLVTSVTVIFISFSATYITGILRGAGDTRFCLGVELATLWGFALPLSAFFAMVLQLPVPLVLLTMRSDEMVKTVICTIRISGKRWIKSLARDKLT